MEVDSNKSLDDSGDFLNNSDLLAFDGSISRRVVYIHSDECLEHCNRFCKVAGRASMVHSLIESYGLLKHMRVFHPSAADEKDLELFHTSSYVSCLRRFSEGQETEDSELEREEFGLNYDCPAFEGVFDFCRMVAGASICAADCIIQGEADAVINWSGGWHHAKRDEAAGFCYVNDIVLCILRLLTKFKRILYVDLDLHHGDGVEDAFCASAKVMTVSFHKKSPGFFPGSGEVTDCGLGRGKYFAVNVPLKDGVDDETYVQMFTRVIDLVTSKFHPEGVVCQCGADGIAGDPEASYNLTPRSMVDCIQQLNKMGLPLVILGGGGYNFANTARCWTSVTASLVGASPRNEIPDHDEFFTNYGPDFELNICRGNMRNNNTTDHLESILSVIGENLSHIS